MEERCKLRIDIGKTWKIIGAFKNNFRSNLRSNLTKIFEITMESSLLKYLKHLNEISRKFGRNFEKQRENFKVTLRKL